MEYAPAEGVGELWPHRVFPVKDPDYMTAQSQVGWGKGSHITEPLSIYLP